MLPQGSIPFRIHPRVDFEKSLRRFFCPNLKATMYFTNGSSRAFEMLMRGKPGFDRYENGGCADCEDCNTCHFYRPHWKYQFCVYAECPYEPGKLTAIRRGTAK